jgi:hypothetical protein
MAELPVDSRYIRRSLEDLLEKVKAAVAWAKEKEGANVTLQIPEPYYQSVDTNGPTTRRPCIGGPGTIEECSDVGILIGVLDAMKKPARKVSTVKPNPKRKAGKR